MKRAGHLRDFTSGLSALLSFSALTSAIRSTPRLRRIAQEDVRADRRIGRKLGAGQSCQAWRQMIWTPLEHALIRLSKAIAGTG